MIMKCPHCNKEIPPPPRNLLELKMMIGKGWLWGGLLPDDRWKSDEEVVDWLRLGWIQMDPAKGFMITRAGENAVK